MKLRPQFATLLITSVIAFLAMFGIAYLNLREGRPTRVSASAAQDAENRRLASRVAELEAEVKRLKAHTEPLPAEAGSLDAHAERLEFPPAADLESAEVQLWREATEWKPVPLKDAKELVAALSNNYRCSCSDGPEVMRVLRTSPEWTFRLKWRDGTVLTAPVTRGGGSIQFSEKSVNGVSDGMNHGIVIVNGGSHQDLVDRCVGQGSSPHENQADPEAPK